MEPRKEERIKITNEKERILQKRKTTYLYVKEGERDGDGTGRMTGQKNRIDMLPMKRKR